MSRSRFSGLWKQRDFRHLWAAHSVSVAGSAVTGIALPLTAIEVVDASAAQLGVLGAVATLPALLFGLPAGVWVDRWRRHPLLVRADLGRGLLLGAIPLAALLDLLTMEVLYVVAFAGGILGLFFDIAITSFLPTVVARGQLVDGNSKLATSDAVATVAGPSLGGVLVQLVSAPGAIAIDAVSFLTSALLLRGIQAREPTAVGTVGAARGRLIGELMEGLRFLVAQPLLRAMTLSSALGSVAVSIQGAVLILYATTDLGISAALLGVVFASRGIAALIGAWLAGRVGTRLGPGRAIIAGTLVGSVGAFAMALPSASSAAAVAVAVVVGGQVLLGLGAPIYSVNQLSLRQAITPDRLLGRVNAGRRFVVFGVAPLGALAGGFLGEALGLRAALLAGALCMVGAVVAAIASPLRSSVQPSAAAV